ncbi:MAG: ubiquinol-cytochrome c reductase iron-sulfur subunit [Chloroflexi bacterium]|nr:ubiquinol-cytochrome c reductase iron-sulfur subunit [Chloroflexota bacterium]
MTLANLRRQQAVPLEERVGTPVASPVPRPRGLVSRRVLILGGFWSGLMLALIGVLGPSFDFLYPRRVRGFGGPIPVARTQIPPPGGDPLRNFEGRFWLVHLEPGTTPHGEKTRGGVLALWTKCPHLGCTVPWRPEFNFLGRRGWFRCPCHGSTYTKDGGIRVYGPAPRSMDTFPVEVKEDGSIVVETGPANAEKGSPDNPSRAVKIPGFTV